MEAQLASGIPTYVVLPEIKPPGLNSEGTFDARSRSSLGKR